MFYTTARELFALKYIDPTYMIRAVPSNAADNEYCTLLAHSSLHGAMAGYTGFVAGLVNGKFCYIPLDVVCQSRHAVDVTSHVWNWLKSVNNQPDFVVPAPDPGDELEPTA
jgi:6-phosphofructokinase 1